MRTGQGACQAIESGFALAQILKKWHGSSIGPALQFFQDFRKPRTDRITLSSYETGKLASADIPEEFWSAKFDPEAIRDRMKWVMEFDLIEELAHQMQAAAAADDVLSPNGSGAVAPASVQVAA